MWLTFTAIGGSVHPIQPPLLRGQAGDQLLRALLVHQKCKVEKRRKRKRLREIPQYNVPGYTYHVGVSKPCMPPRGVVIISACWGHAPLYSDWDAGFVSQFSVATADTRCSHLLRRAVLLDSVGGSIGSSVAEGCVMK